MYAQCLCFLFEAFLLTYLLRGEECSLNYIGTVHTAALSDTADSHAGISHEIFSIQHFSNHIFPSRLMSQRPLSTSSNINLGNNNDHNSNNWTIRFIPCSQLQQHSTSRLDMLVNTVIYFCNKCDSGNLFSVTVVVARWVYFTGTGEAQKW